MLGANPVRYLGCTYAEVHIVKRFESMLSFSPNGRKYALTIMCNLRLVIVLDELRAMNWAKISAALFRVTFLRVDG